MITRTIRITRHPSPTFPMSSSLQGRAILSNPRAPQIFQDTRGKHRSQTTPAAGLEGDARDRRLLHRNFEWIARYELSEESPEVGHVADEEHRFRIFRRDFGQDFVGLPVGLQRARLA